MSLLWWTAGFALALGVGSGIEARAERRAAEDIAARLQGEQKQVSVDLEVAGLVGGLSGHLSRVTIRASDFRVDELPLFTEPDRSTSGKLDELVLELSNFSLGKLRLESLVATIPNNRYDFGLARAGQIRLSRSGVGSGEVRIREDDLEAFILDKYREIKRVDVTIDGGKAIVRGYGEFLIAKTTFLVVAGLSHEGGTKLNLTDPRIFFGAEKASELAGKVLLDTLNPVVDLRRDLGLFDAIEVEGLELDDGVIRAWGRTRIPVRPAETDPTRR